MTKPETPADPIAERFSRETAGHEMTILHDDGLYRHLRFMNSKDSAYWFDLITVPGSLIFRGDGESFVFARLKDMFGFFRSNPDRLTHRINPGYWSEKLTSDRGSVNVYSQDVLAEVVAGHLEEAEEEWPGVTAAWAAHADEDEVDLGFEETARQVLNGFEFGAKNVARCSCGDRIEVDGDAFLPADWRTAHPQGFGHAYKAERVPGFRFDETWEWHLKDYHWWFLWACHGIVTGIARYDAAKAAEAPVELRAWILDSPHVDPSIRVYATEAAARRGAEQYVSENAARQPITDLEWRPVDDGTTDGLGGYHELWGKVDGRMYPAQMIVYWLPVLDTPGSDGDHEAT